MLDQSAVGLSLHQRFRYHWRDVILYNLSVGAGREDLSYVYEEGLKAIPTFAVLPCAATFGVEPPTDRPLMPTSLIPGLRTDGSLHMDHTLRLYKPLPTSGVLDVEKVITGVYDRGPGKGAKIVVDISARDSAGELCFTNTMGYLNRWGDGCGGGLPPRVSAPIPEGPPQQVLSGSFPLNAPLLYRLTGDTYPIHVDPAIAKAAGLPGPILHGLCSLGCACRLLVGALFPGRPERMTLLSVRFRGMALPGEDFRLQIWPIAAGHAAFRMAEPRSGKIILDAGEIRWA